MQAKYLFHCLALIVMTTLISCANIHPIQYNNKTIGWRSAQLDPNHLKEVVTDNQIGMVVNLRGAKQDIPKDKEAEDRWYWQELQACKEMGIPHRSAKCSAWRPIRHEQFLLLLDACEEALANRIIPIFHCRAGADRASFGSAVWLIMNGATVEEALQEYKILYGHLDWGNDCAPEMVLRAYQKYEDKLSLRAWVEQHYRREDFLD